MKLAATFRARTAAPRPKPACTDVRRRRPDYDTLTGQFLFPTRTSLLIVQKLSRGVVKLHRKMSRLDNFVAFRQFLQDCFAVEIGYEIISNDPERLKTIEEMK